MSSLASSSLSLDSSGDHMMGDASVLQMPKERKEEKEGKESKDPAVVAMSLEDAALDDSEILKVQTQDKELIEVPKKYLMMSELSKTMIEGDKEEKVIELPNITKTVFLKVKDFMVHYKDGDPLREMQKPLKTNDMVEIVGKWYADYMNVEDELLFQLILAANYLDIKPLLDLCCAKMASLIKGKTPEQIRARFSLQNDFTSEEEAAVREENKWAFE